MTLPANLILEKNKPNAQSAWVVLLDVTLTNGTVLRYARAHADLVFGRPYYTNANVMAHWKLNDDLPDTVVIDSGPNSYTGTLVGGDNTEDINIAGQIGGALQYDGAADYVDTGELFLSTFQGSFSISLWAKPDDGQPAANRYICGVQDTAPGPQSKIYIRLLTSGIIAMEYYADGNVATLASLTPSFANGAETWHHIVAVGDSTVSGVGGLQLYFDGVKITNINPAFVGDTTSIVFADWLTDKNLWIGAQNSNGGPSAGLFDGGIDNVMVFNKALNQSAIDCLYNSGTGTELVPQTYTAIGFGLDATKLNNTGEIPTLDLNIHDVGLVLRPSLRTLNGAIGSTVKITVANTSYPAENLAELELDFEVLKTTSNANNVTFRLGAPQRLYERFPLERDFALYCQFRFETTECGYTRKALIGYILNNPVEIQVTAHGFATGDSIRLDDVDDPTPSLDGTYTITWMDANKFSLDGINGGDYAGAWAAGGTAGYATCPRSLSDCRDRENQTRFGGAPGLQQGGLRLV